MLRRRPAPIVSRTRAALFGIILAICVSPLVVPILPRVHTLHEGDRSYKTLEAVHGAQYESNALTGAARDQAAAAVADVPLPIDPSIRQQQSDKLSRLMDAVRFVRGRPDLQQQATELANNPAAEKLSPAGRSALLALDRAAFETIHARADKALSDMLQKPIPQNIQPSDLLARIDDYLAQPANVAAGASAAELTSLREILRGFVVPNFQVDAEATQHKRDDARANVAPVIVTYTRGQVIVGEGQDLRPADIEALEATGVIASGLDLFKISGGLLFALGFGLMLGVYVYQFQPFEAPATRQMVLIGIVSGAALAAVRIIVPSLSPAPEQHYFAFAIPVAAAPMLAASLADLKFAAILAVALGFFAAFIAASAPDLAGASFLGSLESLELATAFAAGGLAGSAMLYRVDRLGRFALSGLVVALTTALVLGAFWLIGAPRDTSAIPWLALAAATNGLAAAIITVGLFVVLPLALGITTRLQLMELAQADQPLLRILQDQAPGTYHHSTLVGALAERAAHQIGADTLLVRVGAYYHDIGKLGRPEFYIENSAEEPTSPHDGLTPEESAKTIREHVTNGLELARQYRLPTAVRDFIPQHHGTRLVTYFYRQAAKSRAHVDIAPFQYEGPKPQSKETAIVMLADSCEAVVRARRERSAAEIDELVDSVIAERLSEGQFDECDITMRELQQVATSFKSTLRAIYHPRIEYPAPAPEELIQLAGG